jgi:hypothetical protein
MTVLVHFNMFVVCYGGFDSCGGVLCQGIRQVSEGLNVDSGADTVGI